MDTSKDFDIQTSTAESVERLHPENINKLKHEKIMLRIQNEKYLRKHPEVSNIVLFLMRNLVPKK